jgi:hypothetical protein
MVGNSAARSPTIKIHDGRPAHRARTNAKIAAGVGTRQCRTSMVPTQCDSVRHTPKIFG